MAKDRKAKRRRPLPHVQTALICERVLEDKDRVQSAIRIVDHLHIPADAVPERDKFTMFPQLMLLVTLKAGPVTGERLMRLRLTNPSGKKQIVGEQTLRFEGDERGVVIKSNLVVKYDKEGLYWFDVELDSQPLTRIPLRISIRKEATSAAKPSA